MRSVVDLRLLRRVLLAGVIKIADFGTASFCEGDASAQKMPGTPLFYSPEARLSPLSSHPAPLASPLSSLLAALSIHCSQLPPLASSLRSIPSPVSPPASPLFRCPPFQLHLLRASLSHPRSPLPPLSSLRVASKSYLVPSREAKACHTIPSSVSSPSPHKLQQRPFPCMNALQVVP